MCLCTFRYREDKLNMDRQMVRMRNSDSYWTNIESRWGHDFVYYASANIRDKIIPFPRDWYKYYLKGGRMNTLTIRSSWINRGKFEIPICLMLNWFIKEKFSATCATPAGIGLIATRYWTKKR